MKLSKRLDGTGAFLPAWLMGGTCLVLGIGSANGLAAAAAVLALTYTTLAFRMTRIAERMMTFTLTLCEALSCNDTSTDTQEDDL